MTSDDASAAMLAEMGACAHRLGVAFAREAERAEDWARKVECYDLFERCFFGVRVSVALGLRLRRAPDAAVAQASAAPEVHERPDTPEDERPETERTERERLDADRDREGERANLPMLLKTLRGVAADAAALPGPPPTDLSPELSALTALLTRKTGEPGAEIRPPTAAGLRNRLSGSAALAIAPGPISTGPLGAGVAVLARRPQPATGPPRR